MTSAVVGITPKSHSSHSSLKRKPRTDDMEAFMIRAINDTVEEHARLANKRVHDHYDEQRRVAQLPRCPLQ